MNQEKDIIIIGEHNIDLERDTTYARLIYGATTTEFYCNHICTLGSEVDKISLFEYGKGKQGIEIVLAHPFKVTFQNEVAFIENIEGK